MMGIKHPAKFTTALMKKFEQIIPVGSRVLDPFAGTGKIHLLPFETVGLEIELEWANLHPDTLLGDATKMPFDDGSFDVICTSPTYGNRMADCHNAKDGSKRNTYTHVLGRKLSENNTGQMQWGEKYRELHKKAYAECRRVVKPNGLFILNVKDHIRKGVVVNVNQWHVEELIRQGFVFKEQYKIDVPSNRYGANHDKRLPYEYITVLEAHDEN